MTENRTVVIVDDTEDMRLIASTIIRRSPEGKNLDIAEAASADDGLRLIEARVRGAVPTLVLCDYRMPGKDGIDLFRALKARGLDRGCTFVLLTSVDNPAHRLEARAAGVETVIEKPFGVQAWRDLIGRLLGQWRVGAP